MLFLALTELYVQLGGGSNLQRILVAQMNCLRKHEGINTTDTYFKLIFSIDCKLAQCLFL